MMTCIDVIRIVCGVFEVNWGVVSQAWMAFLLTIGLPFTIWQVRVARRNREANAIISISQRMVDHNWRVLGDPNTRAVVQSLERLSVPETKERAEIYWANRTVHLSHINLIWQVWELGRRPGKGLDIKSDYSAWQRFAQMMVAKKLEHASRVKKTLQDDPATLASADLWEGLKNYEVFPRRFIEWLKWLAESQVKDLPS